VDGSEHQTHSLVKTDWSVEQDECRLLSLARQSLIHDVRQEDKQRKGREMNAEQMVKSTTSLVLIAGIAMTTVCASVASESQQPATTYSNPNKPRFTISGRAGRYNEDQSYGSAAMKYLSGFIGAEAAFNLPLGQTFSLDTVGYIDKTSGEFKTNFGVGFDQEITRMKLQSAIALNIPVNERTFSPYVGIGIRNWDREKGEDAPNVKEWKATYAVLGMRAESSNDKVTTYGKIDFQIPFSESISQVQYSSGQQREYDFDNSDKTSMVSGEIGFCGTRYAFAFFGEWFKYSNKNSSELGFGLGDKVEGKTFGVKLGVML